MAAVVADQKIMVEGKEHRYRDLWLRLVLEVTAFAALGAFWLTRSVVGDNLESSSLSTVAIVLLLLIGILEMISGYRKLTRADWAETSEALKSQAKTTALMAFLLGMASGWLFAELAYASFEISEFGLVVASVGSVLALLKLRPR